MGSTTLLLSIIDNTFDIAKKTSKVFFAEGGGVARKEGGGGGQIHDMVSRPIDP